MRGIVQSARNFAGRIIGRCRKLILLIEQRAGLWLKGVRTGRRFRVRSVSDVISLLAGVAGAVACGLWLESIAAGLLAFILLLQLGRMVRSLERIAAVLKTQSAAPLLPHWRPAAREPANARSIYVSAKAMERLRPWVEDEGSLTEESAKAYCAVLLDTLAILDPKLAGRAGAEDTWS